MDGFAAQSFIVQQVGIKIVGGGTVVYTYTAGQYRPSMVDASRNTYKALQSTSSSNGSTVMQLTIKSLTDNTFYGDVATGTISAAVIATYGGTGVYYGFASFN